MLFPRKPSRMPTPETALPGRATPILADDAVHYMLDRPLRGPYPAGFETAIFGLGCFWGAERKFWQQGAGIWITAVGYAGGYTSNPSYEQVCSGGTGHTEVVLVVFDPSRIAYADLLRTFWENHDPTQGMRQGNDHGTQYRSAIYTTGAAQARQAEESRQAYQARLTAAGLGTITTEIAPAPPLYFAEAYHQQYLAKVPDGYCGLRGTGVSCPVGSGLSP